MSAEGFTERLHQHPPSQLLVVSGNRPTIQLPALEHGVRVLVITGGYELSTGLMQLAKLNNVTSLAVRTTLPPRRCASSLRGAFHPPLIQIA